VLQEWWRVDTTNRDEGNGRATPPEKQLFLFNQDLHYF
jgi:hypothetical protein